MFSLHGGGGGGWYCVHNWGVVGEVDDEFLGCYLAGWLSFLSLLSVGWRIGML